MDNIADNCYNSSIADKQHLVNLKKEFVMKKLFALVIVIVFAIQLSACGVTTENKQSGTLHLQNTIDNSTTEIKVDADQAYFTDGNVLAYHSNLSVEEMKNSLAESNPD